MNGTKRLALLALVACQFSVLSFGKKRDVVQHAPLPEKVFSAKTIYIQNDSGYAATANKAYTQLQAWGKFQVVNTKEKADLVLVLTVSSEQVEGASSSSINLYNYKTGAWTQGTASAPTTETRHYTQMRLIDPINGNIVWVDQKVWWGKKSATMELIKALQGRMDEQARTGRR